MLAARQITNGAKFEDGRGVEVRVRCRPGVPPPRDGAASSSAAGEPTHTLEATVTDRGRGMTAAECERVFGAYEAAASSAGGGSGLGLYIARACARRAGGDVNVTSAPGQGATFTMRFPVRVAPEDWAAVAATASAVQPTLPQEPATPTLRSQCEDGGVKRTRTPSSPLPTQSGTLRCLLADDHRLNLLVSPACVSRFWLLDNARLTPVIAIAAGDAAAAAS